MPLLLLVMTQPTDAQKSKVLVKNHSSRVNPKLKIKSKLYEIHSH